MTFRKNMLTLMRDPYIENGESLLAELVSDIIRDGVKIAEANEDGIDDIFAAISLEWDSIECDGPETGTRFTFVFPRGGDGGFGYLFELV